MPPTQLHRRSSAKLDLEDDEIDEDLDLPPLDADEGDEPAADDVPELLGDDGDPGGLDDSAAADLDVGDDIDDLDGEEAPDGEHDVDVGPLDEGIDAEEDEAGASDEGEGAADEEGIAIDESRDSDDGGVEGTSENPEDEVDEAALPEIDDGDEKVDDQGLAEALLAEVGAAPAPWAPARVVLLEGAGAAVPCRSVVVAAGRVAAAGEVLLFVEEGARAARRLPFGEGVVAVALADDALLVATARGQLLTSRDGGAEAVSLGAWRTGASAIPVQLAATPGRFWIRAGTALSCATMPAPDHEGGSAPASQLQSPSTRSAPLPKPAAPITVRERGVLAIAASGGTLVAVTLGSAGPAIERLRGDDEGGMEAPLAGPARSLVERGRDALLFAVAAGGRCLALGDGRSVTVSRDGGATFTILEAGAVAAIAFAGDEPDAPLVALVAPVAASPAFLIEVSATGEAARVGELASAERELPAAIAWDGSRELIWVASGAGLIAFGALRQH